MRNHRLVKQLLTAMASGQLRIPPELEADIKRDLRAVKARPDGSIVLSSCSNTILALARSFEGLLNHSPNVPTPAFASHAPRDAADSASITRYTSKLFEVLNEFFTLTTGQSPTEFIQGVDNPADAIRRMGAQWPTNYSAVNLRKQSLNDGVRLIENFYNNEQQQWFSACAALPGTKFVLGGSNFNETSLSTTRAALLYSDSVLIPDPIFPWLESGRRGEKFKFPRMLETMYYLLQLRSIVCSEKSGTPAIIVFPSHEKTLEAQDPVTQDGIEETAVDLFSGAIGRNFSEPAEVLDFARERPDEFLDALDRAQLVVGIDGVVGRPIREVLSARRAEILKWREGDQAELARNTTDAELAWLTVSERAAPLYHHHENAAETHSLPLFGRPSQWLYHQRLAQARSTTLSTTPEAALSETIGSGETPWLGNVPTDELIRLRQEGAFRGFRSKLRQVAAELSVGSSLGLRRETIHAALHQILRDHDVERDKILASYQAKYSTIALAQWLTIGASFLPLLPALTSSAVLTAGIAYLTTKHAERSDVALHGRSLVGVLAATKRRAV